MSHFCEKCSNELLAASGECPNCDYVSSRSPGCYFVDLEALKEKLVQRIKLMEPDDGDEWHDDTAHEISLRVATFFDDEIFDLEQTK